MNPMARCCMTIETPLGPLLAIAEGDALAGLYFADQHDLPEVSQLPAAQQHANLDRLRDQLAQYFAGEVTRFDIPLMMHGTQFQQQVWSALRACAHGELLTYGALAHRVGRPKSMRAVGQAVGRNPWIIVVPCHRVLAANGRLGGFSSSLPRKRALLTLEGCTWREAA